MIKTDTIRAIFTNVLFVIGVMLALFGFSKGTLTGARTVVFDKYPLPSYEEVRCEYPGPTPEKQIDDNEYRTKCLDSLDYERKVRMTEDIVTSITMLLSGIVLSAAFRRFIFK